MNSLKSKEWWKAAGARAFRTFVQTLVACLSAVTYTDYGLVTVVENALINSAIAGVLSLLMAIAGLPELQEMQKNDVEDGK